MSKEKCIQHCCHEHKLKEVCLKSDFKCKVCKYEGQGKRYQCNKTCDFDVHPICGTLPEYLSSFAHPKHKLSLRPTLLIHKCRLCRGIIRGMAYRCEAEDCKFFLHPTCSLIPEIWEEHPKHPSHPLRLRYLDYKKECDVCEKKCKHWRYHCEDCGVDIHVGCLLSKTTKAAATSAVQHAIATNHGGSGSSVGDYIGLLTDFVEFTQAVVELIDAVFNALSEQ